MPVDFSVGEAGFYNQQPSWDDDTARWTSPAYGVRFATVERIDLENADVSAFDMSAWGISQALWELLRDYQESEIRQAARWVAAQQNYLVANILQNISESARLTGGDVPPLQDLFIALDADLLLPKGFRMRVACITNIVPHEQVLQRMDKFVAVLDPSEAKTYIKERTGALFSRVNELLQ